MFESDWEVPDRLCFRRWRSMPTDWKSVLRSGKNTKFEALGRSLDGFSRLMVAIKSIQQCRQQKQVGEQGCRQRRTAHPTKDAMVATAAEQHRRKTGDQDDGGHDQCRADAGERVADGKLTIRRPPRFFAVAGQKVNRVVNRDPQTD